MPSASSIWQMLFVPATNINISALPNLVDIIVIITANIISFKMRYEKNEKQKIICKTTTMASRKAAVQKNIIS